MIYNSVRRSLSEKQAPQAKKPVEKVIEEKPKKKGRPKK